MKNEDFKKKYVELRNKYYVKCDVEKYDATKKVKQELDAIIGVIREQLLAAQKRYFVSSFGNAKLYLDRIELNGKKINFENSYRIEPTIEKRAVVVGYYKNGNPRTKTMPFAFVQIISKDTQMSFQTGNTITEARVAALQLEQKILEGMPLKKELDKECAKYKKQISELEKERADKLEKLEKKFAGEKQKSKKEMEEFLAGGNSEQLGFLYHTSRTILLFVLSIIWVAVIGLAVRGYLNAVQTFLQVNFGYKIEAPESVNFDCNMRFDEEKHVFRCDSKAYTGHVAMTKESNLSVGGEWHTVNGDGGFERYVPELVIPTTVWAVAEPDFEKVTSEYGDYWDMVRIYNNYLNSIVLERPVVVTWNFSEDDVALMQEKWQEWKTEQEQKVAERIEAEEKAAEEARIKAAEEARIKAEEEARAKAEAEAKAKAEEEARKAAEEKEKRQASSSGSSSSASSSGSSGSSGGGYSSSETDVDGYCKDGTKVHGNPHARGKANVCYGHGGWVGN
ncbi:hypothetical protein IJH06_00815 [Candidatus Saccharibacteria bacterium]|nr:hypothetical protein [Candidatus Saccharibacteria bacterium]